MDDAVGPTVTDSSIYANNGTALGDAVAGVVDGALGSARQFDGSGDAIEVALSGSTPDIDSEVTVSVLVKPAVPFDMMANGAKELVHKQEFKTSGFVLGSVGLGGNGMIWRIWGENSDPTPQVKNSTLFWNESAYDEWIHYVGTYNGTDLVLYRNGQEIQSRTAVGLDLVANSSPQLFLHPIVIQLDLGSKATWMTHESTARSFCC